MKDCSEGPENYVYKANVDSIDSMFGKYESSISDSERIRRANRRFEESSAGNLASRVVSELDPNTLYCSRDVVIPLDCQRE